MYLQDVPGFPVAARTVLDASFVRFTSKLHAVQRSTDGETFKLLLSLQDGLRVEAVVMNYDTRLRNDPTDAAEAATGNVRSTLCVSSQVGCQMGCTFCATGAFARTGEQRLSRAADSDGRDRRDDAAWGGCRLAPY